MNKIKAIIIDDETHARTMLKELILLADLNIEIVGEGENLPAAISLINSLKPEVVFLDIEMPGYSGLQINNFLKDKNDFEIIFVTAYNQYAIEALRMSAFDYLLKPLQIEELTLSINRFQNKKNQNSIVNTSNKLEVLTNNLSGSAPKKIVIQTHQGIHYFEVDKIYYLEASGMYTVFHLESGQFIASKPLKDFEDILGTIFFRIHRSYIINCNYVIKYSNKEGAMITLINNTTLPLSRSKKEDFVNFTKNTFQN
ncbi:MAG: LytTR family DNA-binding domain-containing protein [Bacteroidota bacterium]|nr:LytTR family DNA-binding domain-containing protein [Bacteroidota bacterium]